MGLLSSYTTAIAGILGPKFIGPLMQGFSLSYIVVLPVRLLSLLTLPRKDQDFEATILYFSLNIAILTTMAISIPLFFKSKFIKNHIPNQSITIKEEPLMTDFTQEKVTVGTIFNKAGV
jgi:hypothetical protein